MRKTREERRRDSRRIMKRLTAVCFLLVLIFLLLACLSTTAKPIEDGPQKPLEIGEGRLPGDDTAAEERCYMTPEEVQEDFENQRIEQALIEQGYFREDVPLDFLEQDFLHAACEEFGVEYELMLALIEQETDFRNIHGDGGESVGYCQIQPRWWGGLMAEIGAEDLTEPYDNFRTAAAILAGNIEKYGSVEDALTAYNSGSPGSSAYSIGVMAIAEKWRA